MSTQIPEKKKHLAREAYQSLLNHAKRCDTDIEYDWDAHNIDADTCEVKTVDYESLVILYLELFDDGIAAVLFSDFMEEDTDNG